ncbi:DUF3109 family protein [Candidatus Woesearchaeota archaeon]|nr:DUF3109 family protein [Candidatus Woesearchaeota archaeon]
MRRIHGLKIHPSVFNTKFPKQCTLENCRSMCCEGGAWIDYSDREKILKNKELFKRYMRLKHHDETKWFAEEEEEDDEFPSGRSVATNDEPSDFCVFFEPEHGCVLQKAAVDEGRHEWEYKSIFCILFPLTIVNGVLRVDEDIEEMPCGDKCVGEIPIWRACEKEIRYLLGNYFFEKLKEISRDFNTIPLKHQS